MMRIRPIVLGILLLSGGVLAAKPDKAGCSDPALFPSRMPNYRIEFCEVKEFDTWTFRVADRKKQAVEGKLTYIAYTADDRKDAQSGLAVVRNYENALGKIGGKVIASDPQRWMTGSVVIDGKEAWVEIEAGNGKAWLRIVEKKAMQQHVVADAASFANDLRATGHVAVYGIYFDTNKSELKPESTPALAEMAKLLKADPPLKIWVVGHTDSTGAVDSNMRLAQARAEAVVTALSGTHGIAAARMKGYGVGPLAPVASNDSDEGRAKNRRVELVKQ